MFVSIKFIFVILNLLSLVLSATSCFASYCYKCGDKFGPDITFGSDCLNRSEWTRESCKINEDYCYSYSSVVSVKSRKLINFNQCVRI